MITNNQQNLKVHFAGMEVTAHLLSAYYAKVYYTLFTVYPYIKSKSKLGLQTKTDNTQLIEMLSKHTIMDSGLFTLMFGSQKGEKSEKFLSLWTDLILEFIKVNNYKGTYVEVDCQKVLGVEQAWKFREYMKTNTNNRQINVFHIEDGQKGLDRLIEYSDYIALSIPELRILKKKNYTYKLANYIKNKKPEIDIHLLGCTEKKMLSKLKFCTSSDSTSWMAPMRYGVFDINGKKKFKNLKQDKLINKYKKDIYSFSKYIPNWKPSDKGLLNYSTCIMNCQILKNEYSIAVGSQN